MDLTERKCSGSVVFRGHIVTVRVDKVTLSNGHAASREVVEHPGGVAILPLHADGCVTLVRQYRYALRQTVTELPAGKLDPGEDHRLSALRELEEETGLIPETLQYMGCLYPSPGISAEILHLYLARGLRQAALHPDEDELLELVRLPLTTLLADCMAGRIQDAKNVALALKTDHFLAAEPTQNTGGEGIG